MSRHHISPLTHRIIDITQRARQAAALLANCDNAAKNCALHAMADALREHTATILSANEKDIAAAQLNHASSAFIDRLLLNPQRLLAMHQQIKTIAALPDPVGKLLASRQRPNGLTIERVSVPLGVIGVIFESRPNVAVDAAALSLKSGNAVILRGGQESFHSVQAIMNALRTGLATTTIDVCAIQMVPTKDREAVDILLSRVQDIDVIIPRGGPKLIAHIMKHTQIPVLKHLAGLCHTYVHTSADLSMARKIIVNAKMRRPGICGATETLLIDQAITKTHLPAILNDLFAAGCEVRGEEQVVSLDPRVKKATEADFDTEFLAPIIAVKVVRDLSEAIAYIAAHGTQHTEAIIAEDRDAAQTFLRRVDSAIVMHNTSTQFADGGEFGMGAEIGIATGKLHARGPVGVEQLTTFKYYVRGQGQIRP